ncbi:MAG TPA: cation:proton antiporter [Candidatus Limnocylindria bacterium]|nr:cation:proton antiporter [Candidatus Limnocylindria bacterium]
MEANDLAILAGVGLVYAMVSRRLGRTIVTSAIVFLTAGIVLGDAVLGWFTVGPSGAILRLIAESTLALVLFTDASRIDLRTLGRELAVPVRLLAIGLPLTIVAGVGAALLTVPGLTVVEAALLAIAVAPTDAALGAAVVSDERVPSRIRQGLNVESGLNDGLCVPLLLIALAVASAEGGGETAPLQLVFEEIGFGVLGGVVAGGAGAFALRLARERQWVASVWAPVVPLMIVGLAYGLASVLHGSGLIATFVAGMAYGTILAGSDDETARVAETLGSAMAAVTFFIFGAAILPITANELSWEPVLFGVLAVTVVRMLPVALALAGLRARLPTVAFLAWFGPRGLASIVFAVLILQGGPLPHLDLILTAISVTIVISVYAHGITALPLTNRYVAWAAARPRHALHTTAEG